MIHFQTLTLPDYHRFADNMALMNKMVFEELYRMYYDLNLEQAPYDYYNADYVISPKDRKNHDEYFGHVKPLAIDLFDKWYQKIAPDVWDDVAAIKSLNLIGDNIEHAKDMVDLVWYSQQLHDAVREYRKMQKDQ